MAWEDLSRKEKAEARADLIAVVVAGLLGLVVFSLLVHFGVITRPV